MKIDVIIPTWKNRYWLKRCLDSFAENDFPEVSEIIVVDNGGDFDMRPYVLPILPLTPGENLGWTGGLHYARGRC